MRVGSAASADRADERLRRVWGSVEPFFRDYPERVLLTDLAGSIVAQHAPPDAPSLEGGSVLDAAPVDQARDELAAALRQASEGSATLDVPLRVADGSTRWYHAAVSAIDRPGARGLLWTLTDVTRRVREEERLRRAEALLVDTQGVAHLGTWEWDVTEPEARWSNELFKIYGLDPSSHAPSYSDYLTRVHPDDRQRVVEATERALHDGLPYSHDERIFRPDGSMRWLHTWAQADKRDGLVVRLLGVCQDITDRKLAELQVEERLSEKEVLLREVHHRVKNNMQVVSGLLMMQAAASPDPALELSLRDAVDRVQAMSLVHDALYSGGLLSRIDLAEYVRALARHVGRTHHALEIVVEAREVVVDIDTAVNCGLIVNELLSNAHKHAFPDDRAGSARVEVTPEQEGFRVVVEDNGVGMPSSVGPSTLGLRLVRELARHMGGEVAIDTQHLSGTRVVVRIPHRHASKPPPT